MFHLILYAFPGIPSFVELKELFAYNCGMRES
jgi:hypothetical protein